jgi:hypothetical protein
MSNSLLSEIEAFLADSGMSPSYFGRCACGNTELVDRLQSGKRVWPETEVRVRAWMLANAARRKVKAGAA